MQMKTHGKAGDRPLTHNEALVRDAAKGNGLPVRTNVKAGMRILIGLRR